MEIFGQGTRKQLCLFDHTPVVKYTLRQLQDTLQNLQAQWNKWKVHTHPKISEVLNALMARFGQLCSKRHDQEWDDPTSLEPHLSEMRVSRLCIRKIINTFLVMFRHVDCFKQCVPLEDCEEEYDCGIKIHHIMASSDDFSKLSMHWDLMPAARLIYMHDFRGLYNCISQVFFLLCILPLPKSHSMRKNKQVVYFHNQDYDRRRQERKRVHEVSVGESPV